MAERKNWTDAEKAEILKKAEETSVLAASKEYGVARTTVAAWKKKAEADKAIADVKAKAKKTKKSAKTADEKAEKAVEVAEIEVKKNTRKASRKVKEAAEVVEEKAKAGSRKAKAAKLDIIIQSPMGGNITAEEIAAKLPEGAESVFVRVDQNKLWWIRGEETGSVDIW